MNKENQTQKYNLFEQDRQNNIKKCIEKRKEFISNTNINTKNQVQNSPQNKSNNNKNNNSKFNNVNNSNNNPKTDNNTNNTKNNNSKINNNIHIKTNNSKINVINNTNNTKSNKNIRPRNIEIEINNTNSNPKYQRNLAKNKSKIFEEKNRILMTEDTYIMRNKRGRQTLITKEDLDQITCLKKDKCIFEQKIEENEDFLKHLLRSELIAEKKIRKVSEKINKNDKKTNAFLNDKKNCVQFIKKEKYQDLIDMYERKLLYEKIASNYNKKINMSRIKNSQTQEKMEELKEQIKDYEKKDKIYKLKISKMFDKEENEDKLINEAKNIDKNNYAQMKVLEKKELFELNRIKRENALMNHMNRVQSKLNGYLEENDKKEKKIIQAKGEEEKKREEKKNLRNMYFEEIKNKVKKNEKKLEKERQKKIEYFEDKDLKDFAIKQEKIKLNDRKKIMNQIDKDGRDEMRNKLKKIMRSKKNLDEIEKDENFIDNFLYK